MLGSAFVALHRYADVLVQVLASGEVRAQRKGELDFLQLTLETECVRRRPHFAGPSII